MPQTSTPSSILEYARPVQAAGEPFVPSWRMLRVSSTIGLTGLSLALASRMLEHNGLVNLLVLWWMIGGCVMGCCGIAAAMDMLVALRSPVRRFRGLGLAFVVLLGVLANVSLTVLGGLLIVHS